MVASGRKTEYAKGFLRKALFLDRIAECTNHDFLLPTWCSLETWNTYYYILCYKKFGPWQFCSIAIIGCNGQLFSYYITIFQSMSSLLIQSIYKWLSHWEKRILHCSNSDEMTFVMVPDHRCKISCMHSKTSIHNVK